MINANEVVETIRRQTGQPVFLDRREHERPLFVSTRAKVRAESLLHAFQASTGLSKRSVGDLVYLTFVPDRRQKKLTAEERERLMNRHKQALITMKAKYLSLVQAFLATHSDVPFTAEQLLSTSTRGFTELGEAQKVFVQSLVDEKVRKSAMVRARVIMNTPLQQPKLSALQPLRPPPETWTVRFEYGISLGVICLQPADVAFLKDVLQGSKASGDQPARGKEEALLNLLGRWPNDAILLSGGGIYVRVFDPGAK
ncbi:MAG: hypothetical protein NZT92_19920 [Abditibacteriales bacterium]|nr:hypothetical protein [Abditibacteriales bacterium]